MLYLSLFRTQYPTTATIGLACTYPLVHFLVTLQLTRPLKLNILVAHTTNELPIGHLSNLPTQEVETKHCCRMVTSQWCTSQIACTTSVPSSSQIRVITHPCITLCANRQPYEMQKGLYLADWPTRETKNLLQRATSPVSHHSLCKPAAPWNVKGLYLADWLTREKKTLLTESCIANVTSVQHQNATNWL
jgi:hypothetical protein